MRTAIAFTLCVAGLSANLLGQTAPRAPGVSGERRQVAIGCISREGTAASPRYVLTDARGDRPTIYRLEGDRATLERHVGHHVEVAGPLPRASAGGRGAAPTLQVNSLVWIASTCRR